MHLSQCKSPRKAMKEWSTVSEDFRNLEIVYKNFKNINVQDRKMPFPYHHHHQGLSHSFWRNPCLAAHLHLEVFSILPTLGTTGWRGCFFFTTPSLARWSCLMMLSQSSHIGALFFYCRRLSGCRQIVTTSYFVTLEHFICLLNMQ